MELNFEPVEGVGLESKLPSTTSSCLDLLHRMLEYEPQARISAGEALRHEFFEEVREREMQEEAKRTL